MCGIAGILGHSDIVKKPILESMAKRMAHRGPDDEGIEIIKVGKERDISLGLAHRRLSIMTAFINQYESAVFRGNGSYEEI